MRDLLDKLDGVLTESRGLAARQRGEVFKSLSDDSEIYFRAIRFWPEGGGSFSEGDFAQAVQNVQNSMGDVQIAWTNRPGKTGGFGIALFDTQDGNILAFGRYFNTIKPDPIANSWDNKTGVPGYQYASKAAAKTSAGMTPQDILTDELDLTKEDIVDQIATKFGEESELTRVARHIAGGGELPVKLDGTGLSFTAFRDYFCELLQPIALQTGQYTGNAGEAAEKFLEGAGFADCLISFGSTKTEGLSDSIMVSPDGKRIKVSSKGAKGATASAKNLVDAADELERSGDTKLIKKHKEIIDLVREIQQAGQRGSPLLLGVRYGIIDESEADTIRGLHNQAPTTIDAIKKNNALSKRLREFAVERKTDNPERVDAYYHLMAAVAHKAAAAVNEDGKFSKAAGEILNNGALVQVYTTATQKGDEWTLNGFNTVYPSKTVTGVMLRASKTYYSTGIKGNFTFEILKNGAKSDDPDDNGDTTTGQAAGKLPPVPKTRVKVDMPGKPKAPGAGGGENLGRAER